MKQLKGRVKLVAFCGAIATLLFLFLQYVADFSAKQSVCLALVALMGYMVASFANEESIRDSVAKDPEANWHKVAGDFSPHNICVLPKWPELLSNYKFIADKDEVEFRQLFEEGNFHTPISFSVLQGRWDNDLPALLHCHQNNSFATQVDFWEFVPKSSLDAYSKETIGTAPKVRLLVAAKLDPTKLESTKNGLPYIVYEFKMTLEIAVGWWEYLCKTGGVRIPPLDAETDAQHLDTSLVLAVLPFSEFLEYYDPFGIRRYGGAEKLKQTRDRELDQSGWKQKPQHEDDRRCVEHKYFTVTHGTI